MEREELGRKLQAPALLLACATSAPIDSTSSLLLTATDGGTMVIMVLGLMFYNSSILDRTYTVAT
eukprot:scaffold129731_cov27-Tisochrysis_lutea.AAC.1